MCGQILVKLNGVTGRKPAGARKELEVAACAASGQRLADLCRYTGGLKFWQSCKEPLARPVKALNLWGACCEWCKLGMLEEFQD